MTGFKKAYFAIAGCLVAAGIVLAGIGWALSGFDPAVFGTAIDMRSGSVELGGVKVDDPEGLPFIGCFAEPGGIDIAAPSAPDAPAAPSVQNGER